MDRDAPLERFNSFGIAELKFPKNVFGQTTVGTRYHLGEFILKKKKKLFKPKLMICHFTYPSHIYEVLNIRRRIIFFSKIT